MKRALFLLLFPAFAFASSQGPAGPSAASDNSAVGTVAWINPTNIEKEDTIVSSAAVSDSSVYDNAVYLLQAGTVVGTNHLDGTAWPASLAYTSYGGATDLWGIGWTASDINNTNFGAVIQASSCVSAVQLTHYLQANSFNFSIPANTRINGILLEVKKIVYLCGLGSSFVKGTRISTPYGEVPIENIYSGDTVWSFQNNAPHTLVPNIVDQTWSHKVSEVLNLEAEDGKVTTTPEHRFFTGSYYSEAKYLIPGTKVMSQTRYGMISNRVIRNEVQKKKTKVYEFSLKSEPHNYLANGFGVHNPVACVAGECAGVDYVQMTVYYTILPQIGTNAGSGVVGTSRGSGQIKWQ